MKIQARLFQIFFSIAFLGSLWYFFFNSSALPLPKLFQQLQSENVYMRQKAIFELEQRQLPASIPHVIRVLPDRDPLVRRTAYRLLRSFSDQELLPQFIEALQDPSPSVREISLKQLAELRGNAKEAISAILQKTQDVSEFVRCQSFLTLAEINPQKGIPLLKEALKDSSNMVRESALVLLDKAEQDISDFVPDLILALNDTHPMVRAKSAKILGKLEATVATPVLLQKLQDPNKIVCEYASKALGLLGKKHPVLMSQFQEAFLGGNTQTRYWLLKVFYASGKNAKSVLPLLLDILKENDPFLQVYAVLTLGELAIPETAEILIPLLQHSNEKLRKVVAKALGQIRSEEALTALVQQLKDKNIQVQQQVKNALSQFSPRRLLFHLTPLLRATQVKVRCTAIQILGETRSSEVVLALIQMFQDEDYFVRKATAEALKKIGVQAKEAVPILIQRLSDIDLEVQKNVAETLAIIGTPEAWEALTQVEKMTHNKELRQLLQILLLRQQTLNKSHKN